MDKNTIIGFVLIAAILGGYFFLTQPSEEEIAQQLKYNDSIALVQKAEIENEIALSKTTNVIATDSISSTDTASVTDAYGNFSAAGIGTEEFYTLENELVKLTISNKGGRIYTAQLKKYQTHDTLPLILFTGQESNMGFTLVTNNSRVLNTNNLYFSKVSEITKDKNGNQTLILRLKTTGDAYMDFAYTLPANDYMLSFGIKANGMNTVMPTGTNLLEMQWSSKIRQQEKGRKFENQYSAIEYKFVADDVETLSVSGDDEKQLSNKVKWIAFKGQFFSSIF